MLRDMLDVLRDVGCGETGVWKRIFHRKGMLNEENHQVCKRIA